MRRYTKWAGNTVAYIGPGVHHNETGDIPAEMNSGEIRVALKRLAAYEDTGMTPAEIVDMKDELQRIYTALV